MITAEEIEHIAGQFKAEEAKFDKVITVCVGTACLSAGGEDVKKSIEAAVKECGKEGNCKVKGVGCRGLCANGPLVSIQPEDKLYEFVKESDAKELIETLDGTLERLHCPTNVPFFAKQHKVVLKNAGFIDPEKIEDYIAHGGYAALIKALTEMNPAEVIEEVRVSGLRGRGGGGFPTGLKWSTVAKSSGDQKYVVCNGDEGDPGAFMDRSLMEADPHRILEGMAIAGYAVGATEGYLYVRAEYPLAVERLKKAIKQAEKLGLLGKDIAGTHFDFHVEIRLGAGAFVCGEETALLASVEGNRGQPRVRPPYPAQAGLWGKPTLINNVETFGNIAPIITNGGEWFAGCGTEGSKGTKVFAITGRIKNAGLIEVPMGITLREIVFDIGGGIPEGKNFKAVQTGGPSGGCITTENLDLQVDYESLKKVGSMMGSGGMIVMDETSSMLDVARFFMEFCMSESCGKCVPCRVGTVEMHRLLSKIIEGEASRRDIEMLEDICHTVIATSLCGLGMSAPNPILSTLRYFRHEYEEKLINEGDCH